MPLVVPDTTPPAAGRVRGLAHVPGGAVVLVVLEVVVLVLVLVVVTLVVVTVVVVVLVLVVVARVVVLVVVAPQAGSVVGVSSGGVTTSR